METQTLIIYEIIDPVTSKMLVVHDFYTAVDYFNKDYLVYEKHKTVTQATDYIQAGSYVALQWHNNPNFNPND